MLFFYDWNHKVLSCFKFNCKEINIFFLINWIIVIRRFQWVLGLQMLNSFNNMKKNWSSYSICRNIKFRLVLTTHENGSGLGECFSLNHTFKSVRVCKELNQENHDTPKWESILKVEIPWMFSFFGIKVQITNLF